MYFNFSITNKIVNDISSKLINFYELVRDRDKEFRTYLNGLGDMWNLLENLADDYSVELYKKGDDEGLASRIERHAKTLKHINFCTEREELLIPGLMLTTVSRARRFRRVEAEHGDLSDDEKLVYLESAFKAGLYEHVRAVYNGIRSVTKLKVACWYFLKRYCQGSVFRQDSLGNFTTPYGGVIMNPITPDIEIDYWFNTDLTYHLTCTEFHNDTAINFLNHVEPDIGDFIFLDPPQGTRTRAFTENAFSYTQHIALADYLIRYCRSDWLMFLKYDRHIAAMYSKKPGIDVQYYDANFESRYYYQGTAVRHMIIKNY